MSSTSDIVVYEAQTDADFDQARTLIKEYVSFMGKNFNFQGYDSELDGLRELYAKENGGTLYLARRSSSAVAEGIAGIKPLKTRENCCEMKRLYVTNEARGHSIARQLIDTLLTCARSTGYKTMVLDTLKSLEGANKLYKAFDFHEIPPYYFNPLCDDHEDPNLRLDKGDYVIYYEREL